MRQRKSRSDLRQRGSSEGSSSNRAQSFHSYQCGVFFAHSELAYLLCNIVKACFENFAVSPLSQPYRLVRRARASASASRGSRGCATAHCSTTAPKSSQVSVGLVKRLVQVGYLCR